MLAYMITDVYFSLRIRNAIILQPKPMPNYNPSPCRVPAALPKNGKLLHEVIILPFISVGNLVLEYDLAP
jgi:hypothetical protein